jgi:hypothetical protein
MSSRIRLAVVAFTVVATAPLVIACCPVPPSGKPVVNADQTVVILWDAATKTQHLIRKASFKSAADDFGFIVPTPTQPELEESGNEAFPYLAKLTEPEVQRVARPKGNVGCGCGASTRAPMAAGDTVHVLDEKQVAGFNAVVLEAESANALVGWLKEHNYVLSLEVEAWAKPYVDRRWKFTALKVAKPAADKNQSIAAAALRISFKTDQPLFPYREPDPTKMAAELNARTRLLRIYFIGDGRFRGDLAANTAWSGKVVWADKLAQESRSKLLELLKLPATTGPADWWLTEFEDNWPYHTAPADLTFVKDADQQPVKRPPIIQYVGTSIPDDPTLYAAAGFLVVAPLVRRARRLRAS